MIIEVGQVWKKPISRDVIVYIEEVGSTQVRVRLGTTAKNIDIDMLKEALARYEYILLSDLTKALL